MNTRRGIFMLLFSLVALWGKGLSQQEYAAGEAIIRLRTPFQYLSRVGNSIVTDKLYFNSLAVQFGVTNVERLYRDNSNGGNVCYVVKFPTPVSVESLCGAFSQNGDIAYAEPNHKYYALSDDPLFSQQWGMPLAHFPEAWAQYSSGKSNAIVALLDSGIDLDNIGGQTEHPDLQGRLWTNNDPLDGIDNDGNGYKDDVNGFDFVRSEDVNSDGDYADPEDIVVQPNDDTYGSHGTSVAGIVGAKTNNNIGIAGGAGGGVANEDGIRLMIVKVLDGNNHFGFAVDLARAVRYAWQNGAAVINFSLGGISYNQTLQDAITVAATNGRNGLGCIIVGASGNQPTGTPVEYPARYNHVIAVRAQMHNGQPWGNYGNDLDVLAPGGSSIATDDILTTARRAVSSGYQTFGGTSAAAPHVCALAALLLSAGPEMYAATVYEAITLTASNGGNWNPQTGYGLINAEAALARVMTLAPYATWQNISGHPKIIWTGNGINYDLLYEVYRNLSGQGPEDPSYRLISTVFPPTTEYLDNEVSIAPKPYTTFGYYYIRTVSLYVLQSRPSNTVWVPTNTIEKRPSEERALPTVFSLNQNYPNPFNPTTIIRYDLPSAGHVSLKVLDILEREVSTLVNEVQDGGFKSVEFKSSGLAAGVYFYRVKAGSYSETKKMLLLK